MTIIDPREDLIEYYGNVVLASKERMENPSDYFTMEEDDEDEFYDDEEEEGEKLEKDEVMKLLDEKKKSKLH